MGKYIRKCKRIGDFTEVEVAQVGVRTRARALAMAEASNSRAAKRRKVAGEELSRSPPSFKRRQLGEMKTGNSVSPISKDQTSSGSSDQALASCCSSNASTDCGNGRFEFSDPEEEECVQIDGSKCSRERRNTTPVTNELEEESGEVESSSSSMARPPEGNSRRRSEAAAKKMPSENEIEEFFVAAEKDLQKRFAEKYNYDIVKDVPLVGRYEWVQTKP